MTDFDIRPYRDEDADALWELKVAFERGLGAAGDDAKEAAYDDKLTDEYRSKWLGWVDRCVAEEDCVLVAATTDEDCVLVAATADEDCVSVAVAGGEDDAVGGDDLVGYLFLLPERLAFVWDAAVVNEVYVAPDYRGTGLADALFERGLDHARSQDLPLDRVVLDVDRENERARAFYERHGFAHWGEMVAREL